MFGLILFVLVCAFFSIYWTVRKWTPDTNVSTKPLLAEEVELVMTVQSDSDSESESN
jgi:hypothetical protein